MSSSSCHESKTKKRSVHFLENERSLVVEIPNLDDYSEEEKKNLWFARSDYHFSRSNARVISKESERYGYSKNLDDVYIQTFNVEVQEKLNMWALHGHSRRGLERWANNSHGKVRKEDQFMYLKGMVKSQEEMRINGDVNYERLREVGHLLSRKSRLFAQMMGAADEHAARCEFGIVDVNTSPRQQFQTRKKNLGLSGGLTQHKVNRVSDLNPPGQGGAASLRTQAPVMRRVDGSPAAASASPQFALKARPGRVPRVA